MCVGFPYSSGSIFQASPESGHHILSRRKSSHPKQDPEPLIEETPSRTSAFLEIIEQPGDVRFRYRKERYHGYLLGVDCPVSRKKGKLCYPQVKLHNFEGEAVILCWLITASPHNSQPHFHQLLQKIGRSSNKREPIDVRVNQVNDYTAVFERLHIIHSVSSNEEDVEVFKKKREMFSYRNVNGNYSSDCHINKEIKKMDKNTAVLYFVAYDCEDQLFLCETLSRRIKNLHHCITAMLKICKVFQTYGSCEGGDERVIFVDKLSKDVKIRFFEKKENSDEIIWSSFADFGISDIHHQVAIAFRTPPYRDVRLEQSVEVYFQLYREGEVSSPVSFTYTPAVTRSPATDLAVKNENIYIHSNGIVMAVSRPPAIDVPVKNETISLHSNGIVTAAISGVRVKTEIIDSDEDENVPDEPEDWERCLRRIAVRCHHCDFSSVSVGRLRKHIRREHSGVFLRDDDKANVMTSETEQADQVMGRLRKSLGRFQCPECPFDTSLLNQLSHHMRRQHPRETLHLRCTSCSFQSFRHSDLKRHVFRKHAANKTLFSVNNVPKETFVPPRVEPY